VRGFLLSGSSPSGSINKQREQSDQTRSHSLWLLDRVKEAPCRRLPREQKRSRTPSRPAGRMLTEARRPPPTVFAKGLAGLGAVWHAVHAEDFPVHAFSPWLGARHTKERGEAAAQAVALPISGDKG
jgi:hypothetical protein